MRVRRLTETEQIEIKRSVSGYGGVVYPAAMSSQYGLGTAQTGINSAAPNGQNSVDSSSVPTARNRYVYDQLKEMYTSIDQGNADIALKKSMVPRWTYLVGDVLLKLPENAIDYETIHLCYKFLARMDNFYDLRWAANSTSYTAMSVWTEFTRLQEVYL